ncbi:hypothetical protein [Okeania sp. SIO3B5]|uniref:hypothetical protein n=1 Tax=Okeania sp. SIO3B5 TaxID=2607811 RepID=UPI0025DBB932|nr:hypothetical protein [Okeania sp. SIO3B5]
MVVVSFLVSTDISLADSSGCYWMENYTGQYTWVAAPQGNVDKQQCYALDSCDGGLGESGGGCYKWAMAADNPRIPWIICPSIAGMYVESYVDNNGENQYTQHTISCEDC